MQIDKREVERRFRRSMGSYEEQAVAQRRIAEWLADLTREHVEEVPARVLEIGCGTGLLTGMIGRRYPRAELWVNDLVEELCVGTAERYGIPADHCLPGDAEGIRFPEALDLVVSASTFQWFTDLAGMTRRLGACLRDGGLLVFSTFGERNMQEVRAVAGRGLAYPTLQETERLLAPCFDVVYAGEDCHVMEFAEPLDVLRHLKRTGVNGTGGREAWTRGRLRAFADEYRRFEVNGRVPLTYHPLYFVCRKREE